MKRFFLLLIASILFFSSCSIMKKEHWIAVQVYQNNNLLESNYDRIKAIYYLNLDVNKPFELRYFLIPESNEHITITSLEYDNDIISLVSSDYSKITFQPIKTGEPYIIIRTKTHGTGMPLTIRILE